MFCKPDYLSVEKSTDENSTDDDIIDLSYSFLVFVLFNAEICLDYFAVGRGAFRKKVRNYIF